MQGHALSKGLLGYSENTVTAFFFPESLNGIQPIIIESIDPNVEYDKSA